MSGLYDSSTMAFIAMDSLAPEVIDMPVSAGLVLMGLLIRTILGALVVAFVALLLWKIGKLVDAYSGKIKAR